MIDANTDSEEFTRLALVRLEALVLSGRHPNEAAALDRLADDLLKLDRPEYPEDPERWDGLS
jgi:hypothetical protein